MDFFTKSGIHDGMELDRNERFILEAIMDAGCALSHGDREFLRESTFPRENPVRACKTPTSWRKYCREQWFAAFAAFAAFAEKLPAP